MIKNKLHYQEYEYDFSVDGGSVGSITLSSKAGKAGLPLNAVITDIAILCTASFTSGGAATVSVGNSSSATAYSAATAIAGMTSGALVTSTGVPNVVGAANEQDVKVAIAVAALTAGSLKVMIQYVLGA